MSTLARVADRVINRPLLLLPEKLAIITEVLSGRIALDAPPAGLAARDLAEAAEIEAALDRAQPGASRFVGSNIDEEQDGRRRALPYRRTPEGVAIVTITGSLVNRGAWVGASSGLTSYEGIAFQIESAARDPKCRSILLDMESPGGEAVGCFEVAATIRKVGAEKPIHGMVNGMAASAAYAIASACRSITSVESGLSGSIGVVMLHADYSRAVDRAGITPTFIHAGAHKVDGNPLEPLSKEVRGDLQAEVDKFYGLFLETVAAGRGKRLSAKAARATEARTFIGQAAKDAGLVDQIGSFADLLGELASVAKTGRATSRGMKMSVFTQEDIDRARAEGHATGLAEGKAQGHAAGLAEGRAAGMEEGKALGVAEGSKAERGRVGAIFGLEEAKGRESSAQHVALNSDMSADQAKSFLAGIPKTAGIGARSDAETFVAPGAFVDTGDGDGAKAGNAAKSEADKVPKQAGAAAWGDIAATLNAESARNRRAGH